MHIHESLFKYDEDFVSRPELTESWTISPDGKTYTFEILQHDFHTTSTFEGRPLVADDLVESLHRWAKKHSGGKSLKEFGYGGEDVVINQLNDYTIRLPLTNAYSPFISHLGAIRGALQIWPQEIAALDPFQDVGVDNIVGSGPYKLASWEPGFRVILERHETYTPRNEPHSNFAGAQTPYMDRLIFLGGPGRADEDRRAEDRRVGHNRLRAAGRDRRVDSGPQHQSGAERSRLHEQYRIQRRQQGPQGHQGQAGYPGGHRRRGHDTEPRAEEYLEPVFGLLPLRDSSGEDHGRREVQRWRHRAGKAATGRVELQRRRDNHAQPDRPGRSHAAWVRAQAVVGGDRLQRQGADHRLVHRGGHPLRR